MVFCNRQMRETNEYGHTVTILILIDGFLQWNSDGVRKTVCTVTILILIDGFLQYGVKVVKRSDNRRSQSLF